MKELIEDPRGVHVGIHFYGWSAERALRREKTEAGHGPVEFCRSIMELVAGEREDRRKDSRGDGRKSGRVDI